MFPFHKKKTVPAPDETERPPLTVSEKRSANRRVGNGGEDIVCDYLREKGCRIVCRNYYTAHGEIDIIAEDDAHLMFVEVKTRTVSEQNARYGRPARAVNREKRERILFSVRAYLRAHPSIRCPRIDIAEVYLTPNDPASPYRVAYYPAAFGIRG